MTVVFDKLSNTVCSKRCSCLLTKISLLKLQRDDNIRAWISTSGLKTVQIYSSESYTQFKQLLVDMGLIKQLLVDMGLIKQLLVDMGLIKQLLVDVGLKGQRSMFFNLSNLSVRLKKNPHVGFCLFWGVPEAGDGCQCPAQFQRVLRSCYRFTTDEMSFSQCRQLCSDQGSSMTEFDTIEEMWGVASIAPS